MKSMQNNELVSDDQSCCVIECEINNEDAICAIDLFENDDAFLEVLGARTEYPVRHDKRVYKHFLDIDAYFDGSMENKIEGLEELPFPLPSASKMT